MASDSELSKLQAVKELIFGQEIQDYSQEFKTIHEAIAAIQTKSEADQISNEKALQQLEKNITSRIDRLEADLSKKIANLEDKKTVRAKLGKMLIQIGEKLQDN